MIDLTYLNFSVDAHIPLKFVCLYILKTCPRSQVYSRTSWWLNGIYLNFLIFVIQIYFKS